MDVSVGCWLLGGCMDACVGRFVVVGWMYLFLDGCWLIVCARRWVMVL